MCFFFIINHMCTWTLYLILSKQSRAKWLRLSPVPHCQKSKKLFQENPKEDINVPLNCAQEVFPNHPKTILPIPLANFPSNLFPSLDIFSDPPSSVLSDLSPELAQQLNCPIFDMDADLQSDQVRNLHTANCINQHPISAHNAISSMSISWKATPIQCELTVSVRDFRIASAPTIR